MLQFNAVPEATLDVLKKITKQTWATDFQLVGGTALALYWGHRISIDLDFFTDRNVSLDNLEGKINQLENTVLSGKNPIGLSYSINEVKCDFVNFPYAFFYPVKLTDGFLLANIDDIVSLKLGAIANRGAKKDFFDLYFIFHQYNLSQLIALYKKKFNVNDALPLLKSMVYFGDAEDELPPQLVNEKNLTWLQIKKFIEEKVHEVVR